MKNYIVCALSLLLSISIKAAGPCVSPLVEGSQNAARAIAVQTDGKIIAAGFTVINQVKQILAVRYTTTGALDCTFGTNAIITNSSGSSQVANGVGIQSTGKIIIAGQMFINQKNQIVLLRYNIDGTPDTTFGTGGMVLTLIGNGSVANAVAIQSDDKIVIAGSAVVSGKPNFVIARYNADGSPDSSFGQSGLVVQAVANRAGLNAVTVQPSGNIVAGGTATTTNGQACFLLVSLTSSGSFNSGFGTNGIVVDPIAVTENIIHSVAYDSSGNIVVSGVVDEQFTVGRYTPSGQLDTTFGHQGVVINVLGQNSESNGVAVQANNKIVAVGSSDTTAVIFARYNIDGSPDTTFGLNGTGVLTIVENGYAAAKAVLVETGQKIMSGGFACNSISLYQLTTSGIPDGTFGTDGIVHNPQGGFCPINGASGPIIS